MDTNHRLIMKRFGFLTILIALAFVPILFQNCSAPLAEEQDVSSLAAEAPFAFDLSLDHIAYMSCSNMTAGYDAEKYFTFKVGAYYNYTGGLKLNDSFVHHVRNVTSLDKASVLSQSEANKNVYLGLAVREVGNIINATAPSSAIFLGSLTAPGVASVLAANNGAYYAAKFPGLTPKTLLNDTAQYTTNEVNFANPIRTKLNAQDHYLAVTYNKIGDDTQYPLAPVGTANKAYGLGFKAKFDTKGFTLNAPQTPFIAGATRLMTNLQEYNLTTGAQTSSNWECKDDWKFMIIKLSDDPNTLCPGYTTDSVPAMNDPLYERYIALRQMLPATKWGVNLTKRCIVPLGGGADQCYGTSSPIINYNGTCENATNKCPHYVSICKKR